MRCSRSQIAFTTCEMDKLLTLRYCWHFSIFWERTRRPTSSLLWRLESASTSSAKRRLLQRLSSSCILTTKRRHWQLESRWRTASSPWCLKQVDTGFFAFPRRPKGSFSRCFSSSFKMLIKTWELMPSVLSSHLSMATSLFQEEPSPWSWSARASLTRTTNRS